MNKIKFYLLALFYSFSFVVYAENDTKTVEFIPKVDPIHTPGEIDIIPFSDILPPAGYLWDATLFINMNTVSLRTNIRIEKAGEGIVSNKWLSHDEDKVVEYDMSIYGSGEYTVTIVFSNGETYEAVFAIE